MSVQETSFIEESPKNTQEEINRDLSLVYAYPTVNVDESNTVLTRESKNPRQFDKKNHFEEDGLYFSENLFTHNIVKPGFKKMLDYRSSPEASGKLVEIVIRKVTMHDPDNSSISPIVIASAYILFGKKVICKNNKPFNRKLFKLLIHNLDRHNLSIQVHSQCGKSVLLPLPLPKWHAKDSKVDIDFSIEDHAGNIHSGVLSCTISLSSHGCNEEDKNKTYLCRFSNDPNDPQNSLSLLQASKRNVPMERVKYFSLEHPALQFYTKESAPEPSKKLQQKEPKIPDIVVAEQSTFSLINISFRNLFQARRPLKPSSSTLREESALVQPIVEIEWCNTIHTTNVADGPAPIWNQTIHFELPRHNVEQCVKLRLYDQHPVWGQQWLGETRIPLEYHRNYQELERWIALSPIHSPVLLFGYVQASPGQSYTRLYVIMKMEQSISSKELESNAVVTLTKGIQRCLATPYKINGIENPEEAARVSMLLSTLPAHYGPLPPRQALNLSKVDHYGRAALLAVLLQGFDLDAYVLLGSSQTIKWSAFVLTYKVNGETVLWDPEIGDYYSLDDSRCSLIKVSHLINHSGIWENLHMAILPHSLKYDVKSSKDWRPISATGSSLNTRTVQVLDLNIKEEEEQQQVKIVAEIEQCLKDKLSEWRSTMSLTTVFNRHAVSVLRTFLSKIKSATRPQLDKKDLKQLYRAYHTHGFVLNLRNSTVDDFTERLASMKIHRVTGPVEFALVCHMQQYIGKIYSIWLAIIIIRSRD
ncbi:coiled-coil and C2 domain-containing protein 2A isoform X2 [Prorops nasuta]|uniref:coiled-coil and C2 domain-containing protein 2A isoform X2 n=1 Tax=Prorops nasuta TaxID=863751 RepID=UPI0034CD7DEB